MPTNPLNPLQEFTPADVLRVQVDTSELPNLFLNPIGEYGVWGWDTANISNTALTWNSIDMRSADYYAYYSGGASVGFLITGSAPSWMTSGATIYMEASGHEATGYFTVSSTVVVGANTEVRLTIPTALQGKGALYWGAQVYGIYQFVNTTSDVSAYLKYSASYFETTVSQAAYMLTKIMPITAGQWAGASLNTLAITASHTLRFSFQWLDDNGVLLSTSTTTGALSGTGAHYLDARQAPANTAYLRFKVQMYNGTGTTNPAANARVWFSETVVTRASTSGELQTSRTNLIANPSFTASTSPWTASNSPTLWGISNPATSGIQGLQHIRFTRNANAGFGHVYCNNTTQIPVTAGQTYTLSAYARSNKSNHNRSVDAVSFEVLFQGNSSNRAGASWAPSELATWTRKSRTFIVPAGVTYVTLWALSGDNYVNGEYFDLDGLLLEKTDVLKPYFDGSSANSTTVTHSWTGTANNSASTEASPTYGYVNPELSFSDVLGRSSGLTINREELDVGTLTVSAKDASLDPSKADMIRPGRKIRAQVLTGGAWETFYLGAISNAKVNYDLLERDTERRSIVEITASDGVQTLANSRQPNGVAILDDLGPALYAVNLPAMINGEIATNTSTSGTPTTYTNDSASALDVVSIARDSESGYAWVSRDNILNAWSPDLIPTTVAQTFDGDDYNADFNVDYDTERCINSVSIKALRITGTGENEQTEEWSFGPYRDTNSISEWGTYSAEFTVSVPVGVVLNTAYFQSFANAILTANATPRLRVNSLTFPVKDEASLARTLIDLYDLVEVTNAEAGITAEQMRVTGISHTITPTRWLVTLNFAHEGSVATPQLAPPLKESASNYAVGDTRGLVGSTGTGTPTAKWTRVTPLIADSAYPTRGGSVGVNGASMVAEVSGYYQCSGTVQIESGGGPRVGIGFDAADVYNDPWVDRENAGLVPAPSSGAAYVNGSTVLYVEAGKLIRMWAFADTYVVKGLTTRTWFRVIRIG